MRLPKSHNLQYKVCTSCANLLFVIVPSVIYQICHTWISWKNWLSPAPTSQHYPIFTICHWPLRWRHNVLDGVSDHQPHDCLLNRLFGRGSKKTSKSVTGLCAGNSPGTGEFSAQMASNAENVSIWWRHHASFSGLRTLWNITRIYAGSACGTTWNLLWALTWNFNDDLICAAPLKMADSPWLGIHPVELECFKGKSPGAPLSIRINLNSSRDK